LTRFVLLSAGLAAFMATPEIVKRLRTAPAPWRVRLAFLSVLGIGISSVSLLAVLLFPEVLVVSRLSDIWEVCSQAVHELIGRPLLRLPSLVAGTFLATIVFRFGWALAVGVLATGRARVRSGEPRWTLAGGEPVFVLGVEGSTAYSLGIHRRQVVVSRGLLKSLDEDEVRAVLLHEEGHFRARHHGKLMAARAVRTALDILPPVRAAIVVLEQAMEEAADEHAARRLGDPATVGSALSKAALGSLGSPVGALPLAAGLGLPGRVRRLLEPEEVPHWVPWTCLGIAAILVASLAVAQAMAGLAILAATHHAVGLGAAALCPLAHAGAAGVLAAA
jgi:Zn-dependent protease with chaperone function